MKGSGVFQFTGNRPVAKQEVKSTDWYLQAKVEEAKTIGAATRLLSKTRLKTDGLAPQDAPAANALADQIKAKKDETMKLIQSDQPVTFEMAASIANGFEYKKDVQTGLKEAFINAEKRTKYLDRLEQAAVSTGRWGYYEKVSEAADADWGGTFNPDGSTNEFEPGEVADYVDIDALFAERLRVAERKMEQVSTGGLSQKGLSASMDKAFKVPGSNKMAYTYNMGKDKFNNVSAIEEATSALLAEMQDPNTKAGAYFELMGKDELMGAMSKLPDIAHSYERFEQKASGTQVGFLSTPKAKGRAGAISYANGGDKQHKSPYANFNKDQVSESSYSGNVNADNRNAYMMSSSIYGKGNVSFNEIGDFTSTANNSELIANNPSYAAYLNNPANSARTSDMKAKSSLLLTQLQDTKNADGTDFNMAASGYNSNMTEEQINLVEDIYELQAESFNDFAQSEEGQMQLTGISPDLTRWVDNGSGTMKEVNLMDKTIQSWASATDEQIWSVDILPNGSLGSSDAQQGENNFALTSHTEVAGLLGTGGENHNKVLNYVLYDGEDLARAYGTDMDIDMNARYGVFEVGSDIGTKNIIKKLQPGESILGADTYATTYYDSQGQTVTGGTTSSAIYDLENGENVMIPLSNGALVEVVKMGNGFISTTHYQDGSESEVESIEGGSMVAADKVYRLQVQYEQERIRAEEQQAN